MHRLSSYRPGVSVLGLCLLAFTSKLIAAETDSGQSAVWWNFVIAVIVLAVSLASAALPAAALRQWSGGWRLAAVFPLLVLAMWIGIIVLSRLADSNSHRLWPFEIFSWAMLNMIYMVAVMTYKRQIDKAEQQRLEQSQAEGSSSDQAS